MSLWIYVLIGVAALAVVIVGLYALAHVLEKREPYASFMRLGTRQKIRFFKLLATAPELPRRVKFLPIALAAYLAFPIDIVPDFIPVLGYVDDVAIVLGVLALIVRWTPRGLIDDLISRAQSSGS